MLVVRMAEILAIYRNKVLTREVSTYLANLSLAPQNYTQQSGLKLEMYAKRDSKLIPSAVFSATQLSFI